MEQSPAQAPAVPDPLVAGLAAFDRHAWGDAFELLTVADRTTAVSGADLERLADAAFFSAQPGARQGALERAFAAHEAAGDHLRAAFVALLLADWTTLRGNASIAGAWRRRAERLLEGQPEDYPHAYLTLLRSEMAKASGDLPAAAALAEQAVEVAARSGHPDAIAMTLTNLAMLRIATGATSEGVGILEEAAISATSGELSPIVAGITSCQVIAACRDLTDYQRAREWLKATDQWCERQEVSAFPGICRVHRGEISALTGAWDRAEGELQAATKELEAFDAFPPLADGLYALGDLRRLKGDVEGAEAALRRAHSFGRSPQPALALIRLAAGKVDAAGAAIESALAEATWNPWARVRLLEAKVEIRLAARDVAGARHAAEELGRIGDDFRPPAFEAGWRMALGRVLLAEGDAAAAIRELRASIGRWREVGAVYEVGRAQVVLARALQRVGDDESADLELDSAREAFEKLGARPDLEALDAERKAIAVRRERPTVVRRTFLFTDIVGSTNLAEAMGDDAWEGLLGWHDTTLRGLIERFGGRVVNSTGDGFFAAFDTARDAIDCAVAIQKALAEHRRTVGFAPSVRIGLHSAEATRRGDDYSGIGVHVAARIGAIASGGQILASAESIAEAGGVGTGDEQSVEVKGVREPVRIASIRLS